jgi:prephenate dehydrogenase
MTTDSEEPAFLRDCRVAIIGLGLMGGSLALALRGQVRQLLGSDPDPATAELARSRQVVDVFSPDPGQILPESDLVVLAAPVRAILRLLEELPQRHPGRAVVLDLGSTKRQVLAAMQALPERFEPLGGHPMCGKETGSLAAAEAGLFQERVFAFTPLPRTSERARRLALELAQAIGARALWLDAATHDRWTAASSHLPYWVASALAGSTPAEAAPLIGTGFASTSRVAASPSGMMLDVLLTNPDNLLEAIGRFRARLDHMETCLRQGDATGLLALLEDGAEQRGRLVPSQTISPSVPSQTPSRVAEKPHEPHR